MDSVERITSIIECLLQSSEGRGIREIAKEVDIPRSSIQRLLMSLEKTGWLY
ncbi:MAG: hypothetical protein CSA35_03850 [Dethiosulfovibrio peptidovorans]|nr:MAG: hypothetical protein CSA35_03850 [Dethiosulfovibrio peptidovorans]